MNHYLAAILGFFLYPLRPLFVGLILIPAAFIAVLVFSIPFVMIETFASFGFLSLIMLPVGAVIACSISVYTTVTLIGSILTDLIKSPFEGLQYGFEHGLIRLAIQFLKWPHFVVDFVRQIQGRSLGDAMPEGFREEVDIDVLMQVEPTVEIDMTIPLLNEREKSIIERQNKVLFDDYNDLMGALGDDLCPILAIAYDGNEVNSKKMLLIKQLEQPDGSWCAKKGFLYALSYSALNDIFERGQRNPFNRDVILPDGGTSDETGRNARYIVQEYKEITVDGIKYTNCVELNRLMGEIRQKVRNPTVERSRGEIEAERVRQNRRPSLPLSATTALNQVGLFASNGEPEAVQEVLNPNPITSVNPVSSL